MKTYFFILSSLFYLFFSIQTVEAADIYIGPANQKIQVGSTFTSVVYISSTDKSINSADGVIKFPSDLLSVESVSVNNSIFSVWVEQPSFSNSQGTVSFEGGVPNPGFKGSAGTVLRINFKVKNPGVAALKFSSATVYANDGLGTDVTSSRGGSTITLTSTAKVTAPVVVPTKPAEVVPVKPVVKTAPKTAPKSTSPAAKNSVSTTSLKASSVEVINSLSASNSTTTSTSTIDSISTSTDQAIDNEVVQPQIDPMLTTASGDDSEPVGPKGFWLDFFETSKGLLLSIAIILLVVLIGHSFINRRK